MHFLVDKAERLTLRAFYRSQTACEFDGKRKGKVSL